MLIGLTGWGRSGADAFAALLWIPRGVDVSLEVLTFPAYTEDCLLRLRVDSSGELVAWLIRVVCGRRAIDVTEMTDGVIVRAVDEVVLARGLET
jgi:hypothetical protein